MDGISVGVNLFDVEFPPYVICNNNDGTLKQVDLNANPATVTQILAGGSRGDFSVVGYDGCIYATQTDRVVKIAGDNGQCLDLYPTCPNRVPSLSFIPSENENVTLNTNYCLQLHMSDNPESLSWSCTIDWGDLSAAEPCHLTQNPQTITLCHTYTDSFAGFLPITATVIDDQRFPAGVRKFIQVFRAGTSGVTSAATSVSGSGVTSAGSGATSPATSVSGSGVTSTGSGVISVGATGAASGNTVTGAASGNTQVAVTSGSGNTGSNSISAAMSSASSMYLILTSAIIALFFSF